MSELNSRRSSIAIVTAKENLSELTQQQTFLRLGSLLGFLRVVSPSGPRQWFAKSRSPVRIWVPPFQMTVKAVVRSTTGRDVFVIASRPFLSMLHSCTVRFCRRVTTVFIDAPQLHRTFLSTRHNCSQRFLCFCRCVMTATQRQKLPTCYDTQRKGKSNGNAKTKAHRVGKNDPCASAGVVHHVRKRYRYRYDEGGVGLAF